MRKLLLFACLAVGLLGLSNTPMYPAQRGPENIKLLVLIIASDQFPVYVELQKLWRSYLACNAENVEGYFLRENPNLPEEFKIQGDIIWARTDEGWPPKSAGILNKTILGMEAMLPRLHEFDFVLRVNLSSFYVFPRLLEELKKLSRTRCYFASQLAEGIGSGSGFILSSDVVELLVRNKQIFINNFGHDDVEIGRFLIKHRIPLIPHKRMDLLSKKDWEKMKNSIPSNIFHFRVKSDDKVRLIEDIYIHMQLRKMFFLR